MPDLFVRREGFGFQRAVALLDEDLHLALGGVEFLLAGGRQADALFEELERVFEARSPFSSWSTMVSSFLSDSSNDGMA